MIPAGTLKYYLTFIQLQNIQSDSGFISKQEIEVLKSRAAKVKSSGKLIEDAKELFKTNQLVFKLRNNKVITDSLLVIYDSVKYNISFLERNLFDNSIEITLEKVNV